MIVKSNQVNLAIEFQEWHDQIKIIKTAEQRKKADWYYNTIMNMKKETGENIIEFDNEPEDKPSEYINLLDWKIPE